MFSQAWAKWIVISLAALQGYFAQGQDLRFDHEPLDWVGSGLRIEIETRVEVGQDSDGPDRAALTADDLEVARVYFRAGGEENFLIVPMLESDAEWLATLPAPSPDVGFIEYLLLAKRFGDEDVFRSPLYEVAVEDWGAGAAYNDSIQVYTELAQAPETVAGFTDNIALDVVESAARYGIVAHATQQSASSASASAAGSNRSCDGFWGNRNIGHGRHRRSRCRWCGGCRPR